MIKSWIEAMRLRTLPVPVVRQATGTALNPLLGRTAVNLLVFSSVLLSASLFS